VTVLSAQNDQRNVDKCRHNSILNVLYTARKEQTDVNITAFLTKQQNKQQNNKQPEAPYTHSVKPTDFYCVTSYLMEKLSKLRSFDRQ
jgi:hypothetical protein